MGCANFLFLNRKHSFFYQKAYKIPLHFSYLIDKQTSLTYGRSIIPLVLTGLIEFI